MVRRAALVITVVSSTVLAAAPAGASPGGSPGAPGIGDPYFPLDGNGGYDVKHYGLDIKYTPETDVLAGKATIRAKATQNLSAFNLDFEGLTIRSITVDGRAARWSRDGGELTVTPRRTLRNGKVFVTKVVYDGIPQIIRDPNLGDAGVFATDDGVTIIGQPDVAATWFPVNDHPLDKASYDIDVTVPAGLEAVSNGILEGKSTRNGWTTWRWDAREPMASYLATAVVSEFDLKSYRADGIRYIDALDPALPQDIYDIAAGSFARQPEIVKFLVRALRAVPVQRLRRHRRQQQRVRLRAGEPDPADLRARLLRQLGERRRRGGPRAGPHVVRRQPGDRALVGHLAERGVRQLRRVDVERGPGPRHRTGDLRRTTTRGRPPRRSGPCGSATRARTHLFDGPVYDRGAMTMHALRLAVGDRSSSGSCGPGPSRTGAAT